MYRGRGSTPYDPVVLLKMVLFQYLKGHLSPATWYEEARFNDAMRWLGRGYVPARRTWYDFRDRAGRFIDQVHAQMITRALDEGHLNPTVGVQDGTAIAACASRHRMINRATLEKRSDLLHELLQGRYQKPLPRWVPATETGRRGLANRMHQAATILNERIAKNAQRPPDKRKDPEKIQVSLSDPTAPLGRDKLRVFRPLYTVQYMVAPVSDLIMSYCCEPDVTDVGTLAPMIDLTRQLVGDQLTEVIADAIYCSIVDLQDCRERGVGLIAPVQANRFTESKTKGRTSQIPRTEFAWDEQQQCYHCPAGYPLTCDGRSRKQRHSNRHLWEYRYRCDAVHCAACPLAAQCLRPRATRRTIKRLEDQDLLDAQRKRMAEPAMQERYRIRGQTAERAYADSKGNRAMTRFHGRGLFRARTETALMVVAQNLLRLDRLQRNARNPTRILT